MKISFLLHLSFFLLFSTCLFAQTDKKYGLTEKNPIMVGGEDLRQGPVYERNYLENLTGPNGEIVTYERVGSCCSFETPNGILGGGMLDKYAVSYDGIKKPIILFLNMYDPNKGEVKAPEGFKLKEQI